MEGDNGGTRYFQLLYDYGYWARDRLLAVANGLGDEDLARPNGPSPTLACARSLSTLSARRTSSCSAGKA